MADMTRDDFIDALNTKLHELPDAEVIDRTFGWVVRFPDGEEFTVEV